MPNHLSNLGIFHTVISILALIVAFIALFRDGRINSRNTIGKWYVVLTAVTCITALAIMKTGHVTPGHGLAVLVLVLLALGYYAHSMFKSPGTAVKAEAIFLSLTLFFSFIPAITETLTRLPIGGPIAASPDASVIKTCYLVLLVAFVLLIFFQVRRLRQPAI